MPSIRSKSWIVDRALTLPRAAKRAIALAIDAAICVFSVWFAFYLRLGEIPEFHAVRYPAIVAIAIALPLFVSMGLYRAIFRYAGPAALAAIARAVAIYALVFGVVYTIIGFDNVPRTVGLIQPILLFLMIGSTRLSAKLIFDDGIARLWRDTALPRVLIYGAGAGGRQLASAIASSKGMQLVGFIDDNRRLWRSTIDGIPILPPDQIAQSVAKHKVTDVLLAVRSATRERRHEIVHQLKELGLHVRTLPSLLDMAWGSVSVTDIRDLEIDDLLGRAPVPADVSLMRRNVTGKIVLVTGAGGSIGSELCRQLVTYGPAMLLLVERSEFALYSVHQDLLQRSSSSPDFPIIIPLLASVCDERRMAEIFSCWRTNTVLHAAAYKHVPLVEHNAIEGIRNNVFGTLITAEAARAHGTENFVLVSTDKAVRPANIMGTSKRLAEIILQAMNAAGGITRFSMVRFGNVLGSSGSVVPLFRRQIADGGPLTVTHPDITRFFMTIEEAAQLVLQAGAMAEGGEVFVLDMGEPVKIADLARNMIELSGLTIKDEARPHGDIEIQFVGLRPGEKLFEELLIGNNPTASGHPRIKLAHEGFISWQRLTAHLSTLEYALDHGDAASARTQLRAIVPEFGPTSEIVDFVSSQKARLRAVDANP